MLERMDETRETRRKKTTERKTKVEMVGYQEGGEQGNGEQRGMGNQEPLVPRKDKYRDLQLPDFPTFLKRPVPVQLK